MEKTNNFDAPKFVPRWETPDWHREHSRTFWDPARKLLKSIRDYQAAAESKSPLKRALKSTCVLRHKFWSVITGAEIHLTTRIEGGLLLPHPNGIVIHPESVIGANCLIFQQVTLAGKVELGYHVDIGAGAKLLGPIKIGNNVKIGANSVVTQNIEDGVTVVGIPARIISKNEEATS